MILITPITYPDYKNISNIKIGWFMDSTLKNCELYGFQNAPLSED